MGTTRARTPGPTSHVVGIRAGQALRDAVLAAGCCLLIVFVSGTIAFVTFGASGSLVGVLDPPGLVEHLGSGLKDALAAPFARWDSAWYLLAAHHGYGAGRASPAFFPLYPLLAASLGALGPGDLVAGVLVSVGALIIALRLVWLLTRLELGESYPEAPRLAVFAAAFFPTAFFLTAVYPQSLLLASSAGAFWFARHDRWALAGFMGALAAAAHPMGVLLVAPLGLLYLSSHRWRLKPSALWLALVPSGYAAFMLYLAAIGLDPIASLHAAASWQRNFTGPFTGIWDASRAAVAGVQQVLSGQTTHVYWSPAIAYGYAPMTAAADNLELFGFLVLGVAATVSALRRLPLAYGVYLGLALAAAASYPVPAQPLSGLSRFMASLFPLQMIAGRWLAIHERWRLPLGVLSILVLIFYTGYFATWHWVG
jgi:hypothetical protein